MKTLLTALLFTMLSTATHASLSGTPIGIEFLDNFTNEHPKTKLTFEVIEAEDRFSEWTMTSTYVFKGQVIQSELKKFTDKEYFLAAFDKWHTKLELGAPNPLQAGDILSVEVFKEVQRYEFYQFRIIELKRSNKAPQTTSASARRLSLALDKMKTDEQPKSVNRVAAFLTDLVICGLVATPFEGFTALDESIAYYAPPGLIVFLALLVLRNAILNGRSIGLRIFKGQIVDIDFKKPSKIQLIYRDSILPVVFVVACIPVLVLSIAAPESSFLESAGTAAPFMVIGVSSYLHKGCNLLNKPTVLDKFSKTRVTRFHDK